MNTSRFFIFLALLTLFISLAIPGMNKLLSIQEDNLLSWWSVIFFFLFNCGVFFLANKTIQSKDKNAFTRLIIGVMGVKMMLAVVLVFIYVKTMNPQSKYFIIPFILIYIIYTAFETYFMTKLSKTQP